jgi:C1A family cysteine protease
MKTNIFISLIISILILSSLIGTADISINQENQTKTKYNLLEIQKEIINQNVNWSANYTSYNISSNYICNYEYDIETSTYDDINYISNLPDKYDWRNVSDNNWITSVKNQGNCGSCTAFGAIGALEAVIQIELEQIIDIDLSEADLYYCNGGDCIRGISISDASHYISSHGVSDELCFPYSINNRDCDDKSDNWENRIITARNGYTKGVLGIKNAVYQYGPVVSAFNVYEDFYYYSGGIYEHVHGNVVGGHSITIVGWNDDPGYWICKNSWGNDWGEYNPYSNNYEKGYFRIKYEDSGIGKDTHFFYNYSGNIQPSKPNNPNPNNEQEDVDININLSWNRSIDYDNDQIFYNLYFTKGKNVGFDDLLADKLYDNYYIIDDLEKNSNYSWFVISEDEKGSQSMSDIFLFKTRSNNPPIINGPKYLKINKNISFNAYPSEICIGNEYYWEFDWDDGSNKTLGPFNECNEINASHIWTKKGEYSIKVRYKEDTVWSNWGILNISVIRFRSLDLSR